MEYWHSLSEGQGTVISGMLTIMAAVIGVFLGWLLFSSKVNDLKSALDESKRLVHDHNSELDSILKEISTKVSGLEGQFTTTLESLGQLRGSVGDLQSESAEETQDGNIALSRDTLRGDWNSIRDLLEQHAAHPEIDGRTRAKYARIDRRRYNDLIDSLDRDGRLDDAPLFRQASDIWQKYRNGRRVPTQTDARAMREVRAKLVGGTN